MRGVRAVVAGVITQDSHVCVCTTREHTRRTRPRKVCVPGTWALTAAEETRDGDFLI